MYACRVFRRLAAEDVAQYPMLLQALWHEAHGDWKRAHEITQDIESADAAWVHAYLHCREGDAGNAAYWYRHAHRPVCNSSLDEEWELIVTELLSRSQ